MFHYFNYSVTKESKEKFKTVFCCFSATKDIVASLYSSNFLMKLICCGIIVYFCLDKTIPMSL